MANIVWRLHKSGKVRFFVFFSVRKCLQNNQEQEETLLLIAIIMLTDIV